MLKTLHELRRWLAQHNLNRDGIHITLAFPDKNTAYETARALMAEVSPIQIYADGAKKPAGAVCTHHLNGFDLTIATSERLPVSHTLVERVNELERENLDLRCRLDNALLELESRLTY